MSEIRESREDDNSYTYELEMATSDRNYEKLFLILFQLNLVTKK